MLCRQIFHSKNEIWNMKSVLGIHRFNLILNWFGLEKFVTRCTVQIVYRTIASCIEAAPFSILIFVQYYAVTWPLIRSLRKPCSSQTNDIASKVLTNNHALLTWAGHTSFFSCQRVNIHYTYTNVRGRNGPWYQSGWRKARAGLPKYPIFSSNTIRIGNIKIKCKCLPIR